MKAVYPITIDQRKPLEQMVKEGKYNYLNDNIIGDNFPITGEDVVDLVLQLVHLNQVASKIEVEAYLDNRGLRAATLEELLAFGATYPEIQRKYPVVALGSSWVDLHGYRYVPYLRGYEATKRGIFLYWAGVKRDEICRFLAAPK